VGNTDSTGLRTRPRTATLPSGRAKIQTLLAGTTDTSDPVKKTGTIWRKPPSKRKYIVETVCGALTKCYGTPRFGNPSDPLDDLIYIILSNKTSSKTANATYSRVKNQFRDWGEIILLPTSRLRSALKPAGLSTVKSKHIRAALRSIKHKFGTCHLGPLRHLSTQAAEKFLIGLPGVSEKVAKCVLMYTLNRQVLPVDTHVFRVSRRLGWTARKRADQSHPELEALVPPRLRENFHVACIAHGRTVCRPHNPLCHECCVRRHCEFFKGIQ
jgi:endonuclease III